MASQPGVNRSSVRRNGPRLVIEYVKPSDRDRPPLDPVEQAERLGYDGLRGYRGAIQFR
ncbi:MAG: hypothetical protein U0790_00860 [Isosphaeraceae bacterium]